MNETWALVGATILLFAAACWYAAETRRMVRRMDIEREEKIRPVLTFQLIPWAPGLIKLRIKNVGSGPAKDIAGKIESVFIGSGSEAINWSYPLLDPDRYEEFHIPLPTGIDRTKGFDSKTVKSKVSQIKTIFAYKSILGIPYKLEDSIDIQEVTKDWLDSKMLVTQDHPDRLLPRIAKALDELPAIARSLEKLAKTPTRKQTPQEMLEVIKLYQAYYDSKDK